MVVALVWEVLACLPPDARVNERVVFFPVAADWMCVCVWVGVLPCMCDCGCVISL